jgi:holo-[acyl-carrier protein] synthase
MIYGTGIDVVSVKRMEKVINRWGNRFIERVFTPGEIRICSGRALPPSAFSMRFAAKEAFSKAIGLGMRNGIRWCDIEVFHFQGGRPGLKLHGRSQELCEKEMINGFHVSMSDDAEYGVAMVILEKNP